MTILDILARWLGVGREVVPPPSTPPHALSGIPVASIGEAAPAASPSAGPVLVSAALLRALVAADAAGWAPILAEACGTWGIQSQRRQAAFLATVLHESNGLRRLVESLDYSAQGLANTWPGRFALPGGPPYRPTPEAQRLGRWTDSLGQVAPAHQEAIAERAYGGRKDLGNTEPGDGWRFRGRGLIQVTGRANYTRLAAATGRGLAELSAWLETRQGAAESAARWWAEHGCNALADAGDLVALRRRVNGGTIGLDAVELLYARALAEMKG